MTSKERLKEYLEVDTLYQDYKKGKKLSHNDGCYDFDLFCVQHCLDIENLLNEVEELHNKIDEAIDVIHTQMKNNPCYKENLKIIEITLIKGSCKVCDLKDSDVDE